MATSRKKTTANKHAEDKLNKTNAKRSVKSLKKNDQFLDTLLELDEHYTRILAVCADKTSFLGHLRPLMLLLEFSCHGVPWLVGATVLLLSVHLPWHVELLVNILLGLIIDIVVITVLKMTFRRSRPAHNKDDMVGAVTSVDKYSFPSGHATRAAMLAGFFVFHVCDKRYQMLYITSWSVCVSLSRVALGRHHLIDVICGYFVGILEYIILIYMWIPRETCMQWLESYFSHFHL